MIVQIGTEVDESRILWKREEGDDWKRADIDDLIRAFESIVRCRDCEYRYEDGEVTHYYWCRLHDRPVDDTDYCAWGKESEVEE